ncbi:MAG: HAMP domain-containing sensor histidine kinase [Pseudomonadota bacterium]
MSRLSLRVKLGLAAAFLGAGTLLTAVILWLGMAEVSDRLQSALESEQRRARFASLSQQAATFLVVSTEAVQRGLPPEIRQDRVAPVANRLHETFALLQSDIEAAVRDAEALGLDVQSRYGTQSLGLARMEALLNGTLNGINTQSTDRSALRAHIDQFASGFDTQLSQAVQTEVLFRNEILSGIDALRATLSRTAIIIASITAIAVFCLYIGLIRPQFRRLERLREAAQQIGREDFAVALPAASHDEIGQLYQETNRMADALAERQADVQAEWTRLNETIADRTEALRAANDQLSKVDENRRRFFADISHELRTPLTVILMEAQIGSQKQGEDQAAFATIETRAARLNRRIDDLLRVARSDTGQLGLEHKLTEIPRLLSDVAAEVGAEVDNAGMDLTLGSSPQAALWCDPNWIRQVLVSLIRNAIRHARSGGAVALEAVVDKAHAQISITDNGPGIDGSDQASVWERFTQGDHTNGQGFGVGLALAKWVVDAHEGRIELSSPVSKEKALGTSPGLRVTLTLPLTDQGAALDGSCPDDNMHGQKTD